MQLSPRTNTGWRPTPRTPQRERRRGVAVGGVEQLPIADIAGVLGIAPNAVKQRLHRAKQHLGREYRKLESERTVIAFRNEEGGQ